MTAKAAYKKIIDEVFKFDENPTFELCQPTIENLVGEDACFEMACRGMITYVGRNHNGIRVYKIR